MKKISLILLLVLSTNIVGAQSLIPTKFGLKAGLNIANISSTAVKGFENPTSDAKIGVAAGIVFEIALSDKWFINPELLFSQKGATFYYDYTYDYPVNQRDEYTTSSELSLSYLDLNVTLSYKATDKIALNFGPSVSFLVTDDYTFAKTPEQTPIQGLEIQDGFIEALALDVGINAGMSYYLSEHFVFDARVHIGLMDAVEVKLPYATTPLVSSYIPPTPTIYTLKNNSFVFSFTYLF